MRKFLVIILIVFFLSGCSLSLLRGSGLLTGPANENDVKGTFTLILYGANHSNDLETIAILDVEGDEYEFEPYAPDFAYRIKKHLSSDEALAEAKKFVSWHRSFHTASLSKVLDTGGNTIGYELRPFYYPFDFGFSDVLDVNYFPEGKKIIVRIKLIESVERRLMGDDGKGSFDK